MGGSDSDASVVCDREILAQEFAETENVIASPWGRALKVRQIMAKVSGPEGPRVETQAEKDALNKVKLNKFMVVPAKVDPYGTVTATWDVTVPNTEFEIVVTLNGQEVANTGSKTLQWHCSA